MNIKKIALIGLLVSSPLCSAGICDLFWGKEVELTDEQVRKNFLDAMHEFNSAARAGHIFFRPLKDIMKLNVLQIADTLDKSQEFKGAFQALLTVINRKPEAIEAQDIAIDKTAKKIAEADRKGEFESSFNEGLKRCHQKHPDKKEKCNQLYKEIARQLFSQAKFAKMFAEEKEKSD